MTKDREKASKGVRDTAVSLAPLSVTEAISGLFAIPDPDAAKPVVATRKKAPPKPAKE
jgi:hypothetical protein